jgi:hypothetical protein
MSYRRELAHLDQHGPHGQNELAFWFNPLLRFPQRLTDFGMLDLLVYDLLWAKIRWGRMEGAVAIAPGSVKQDSLPALV